MTREKLTALAAQLPTPAYVFDSDLFAKRVKLVKEAFGEKTGLCFSIKANPFLLKNLPAEFDITPYVHAGTNTVRVVVYKWACTSYLEDQDQFRCNGIFRDVYLLVRPDGHLHDLTITSEGNAAFRIKADKPMTVRITDGGTPGGEGTGITGRFAL